MRVWGLVPFPNNAPTTPQQQQQQQMPFIIMIVYNGGEDPFLGGALFGEGILDNGLVMAEAFGIGAFGAVLSAALGSRVEQIGNFVV